MKIHHKNGNFTSRIPLGNETVTYISNVLEKLKYAKLLAENIVIPEGIGAAHKEYMGRLPNSIIDTDKHLNNLLNNNKSARTTELVSKLKTAVDALARNTQSVALAQAIQEEAESDYESFKKQIQTTADKFIQSLQDVKSLLLSDKADSNTVANNGLDGLRRVHTELGNRVMIESCV
jgi:hypothetical protein